jgi:hypothetical protein
VALAALFALLLAHPRCRPVRWLVVVSPALFLQTGSDLGRFDFINDVITLLILVSGRRAILAAPVMILIHEGAAAIQMPILFALHLILHGRAWEQVAAAALTLAALAAVALFGRPDPALDIATLYPHVAAEQYAHIAYSLGESFAYVRRVMVEHLNLSLLRNFAVLLAYAGLALAVTLRLLPKEDRRWLGAALLAFAPLALSLVAIDWARWIALAVTNLWIVLIVALIAAPRPAEPGPGTERMIRIGCLFALLGPMGASYPLPGPFALIKLLHGG